MANHTYTFAELKKAVKHALGKTPDGQLTAQGQLVNDALQKLVAAHPWHWRIKYDALDTTSGQNALSSLPADFAGVHTLHNKSVDGDSYSMLDEILPLRPGTAQNAHSKYRYMIDYTAQSAASGEPAATIKIFPAASSSATGGIEMAYYRTIPAMSADTDLPDIPANFHVLLKQLVRAHALIEDHNPAGKDEWDIYTQMLNAFISQDGTLQSNRGAIDGRGGGPRADQ